MDEVTEATTKSDATTETPETQPEKPVASPPDDTATMPADPPVSVPPQEDPPGSSTETSKREASESSHDDAAVSTDEKPAPVDVDALNARIAALESQQDKMRTAALESALVHLGVKDKYREFAPKVDATTQQGKAKLEQWVSDRPEIVERQTIGKPPIEVQDTLAHRAQEQGRGWLARGLRRMTGRYGADVKRIRRAHGE